MLNLFESGYGGDILMAGCDRVCSGIKVGHDIFVAFKNSDYYSCDDNGDSDWTWEL